MQTLRFLSSLAALRKMSARAAATSAFALAAMASTGLATAQQSQDARWAAADAAFERRDFAVAAAEFERLARQGDARAAERAGHMLLVGPALYGAAVPRDLQRAIGWLKQAAQAGSETGALLLRAASAEAGMPLEPSALPPQDYIPGPAGC